jgi:xylose isomerase
MAMISIHRGPNTSFSFGLWTVGNRGRDPFGEAVRPTLPPVDAVRMLADSRRMGRSTYTTTILCLSTPNLQSASRLCTSSNVRAKNTGIARAVAYCQPFLRIRSFATARLHANDPMVRAYSVQKRCAQWIWERNSERSIFVLWGGGEGVETDGLSSPR